MTPPVGPTSLPSAIFPPTILAWRFATPNSSLGRKELDRIKVRPTPKEMFKIWTLHGSNKSQFPAKAKSQECNLFYTYRAQIFLWINAMKLSVENPFF